MLPPCAVITTEVAFVLSHFEAPTFYSLKRKVTAYPAEISGPFSVDLGTRFLDSIGISEAGISLSSGQSSSTIVTWTELKKMCKKGKSGAYECFSDGETPPQKVADISELTNRTASLLPVAQGAPPTLILGGFGMHRLKDTDPEKDTLTKIQAVGNYNMRGRILDVCTGLGYTAIKAAERRGVTSVTTVELDPMVVMMQRRNPWSKGLFENERIERIVGDATVVLKHMEDEFYDVVIHDPPAQAMGGELYSLEFYQELRRVCVKGAKMFHYIGDPQSQESGRLYRGVSERLAKAGFVDIVKDARAFGLTAIAAR